MRACRWFFALLILVSAGAFASDLALVGGKVYTSPSDPPIEHGTVLIHDGTITAVGPSDKVKPPHLRRAVTVIDCTGKVVTAGFWNSHVHFMEDAWKNAGTADATKLESHMQQMLTRWGFTSAFDIGSFLTNTNALRARVNKGEIAGPRIFTVGEPLYPENGIPVYLGPEWNIPQATSPEVAHKMAQQRLADGADGIKVFAGAILKGGVVLPMKPEIIRAAAEVAHAAGKPVFAHPSNHAGTDNALAGGVNVLAHTIPMEQEGFTTDELQKMKAQHVALIPTIALFGDEERKFGGTKEDEQAVTDRSVAQLKSYFDVGGTILFGTDVGYTQLYDTTSEFDGMGRAMKWQDILASLTVNPARFFKIANSGRIAKGMDADVVVLNGDPATDVRNFAKVAYTIRAGRVIYGRP